MDVATGVSRPWIVDDELWALIEPVLPPWPEGSPGPRPVADRLCLQGCPVRAVHGHHLAAVAARAGLRLRSDLLAPNRAVDRGRGVRPTAPDTADEAERGWETGLESRACGRLPRAREKRGAATGPSPVDRRKTGSKHHLICDGNGTPLRVITTAANANDVTQMLALVDRIPLVAGRVGHPRRRPDALLGDKGYEATPTDVHCAARGFRRGRLLLCDRRDRAARASVGRAVGRRCQGGARGAEILEEFGLSCQDAAEDAAGDGEEFGDLGAGEPVVDG